MCSSDLHSPAVLLRSGVDRDAIGRGLQDHPSFPVTLRLHDDVPPHGDTPDIGALLRASYREADDLQVLSVNHAPGADAPGYGVLLGALMVVHSTGSVRLASNDPTIDPVIECGMLDDERDLDGLRAAARLVEGITQSAPVQRIADVLPYDMSDDGLRAGVGDYMHAVGTCRMGAPSDRDAVVDPHCRVIGREALWVCDASVMPRIPRANTHLPTMMIAERVASWFDATD